MSTDFLKIDLRKAKIIDIKKRACISAQKAQVILALDFSESMRGLYNNGTVQDVVERILPLGLAFDDNEQVDFYLFHDGFVKLPDNITLGNVGGYIMNKVINKYRMGGTNYEPVLRAVFDALKPKVEKKGLLAKLGFGKSVPPEKMKEPVYVLLISDGENGDHASTRSILRDMSEAGFFVQFVGIGNESFKFLRELDTLTGRRVDNAGFFKVADINAIHDDKLYAGLVTEFFLWVNQARLLGLIE